MFKTAVEKVIFKYKKRVLIDNNSFFDFFFFKKKTCFLSTLVYRLKSEADRSSCSLFGRAGMGD